MDLGDVLRHLLDRVPGPSDVNHQELVDTVNAVYPPPPPPEPDPASDPQAARIAQLEAELSAAKAQAPGS